MSATNGNKNGTNGQPSRENGVQTGMGPKIAVPAALSAAPTAANLLKALKRRAVLAGTLGILCAVCAAAAVWFFLPPAKRVASVQLRIDSTLWSITGTPREDPRFLTWRDTQANLIKNSLVLQRALNDPKARQLKIVQESVEPVEWLQKEIKIDFPSGPEILRINLSGENVDELKTLVEAVAQATTDEFNEADRRSKRDRLDSLENSLRDNEAKLKAKREEKEKLANQVQAGNHEALIQKQARADAERAMIFNQLVRLKAERPALEAEQALFNRDDRATVKELQAQIDNRVNGHKEVRGILDKLDRVQFDIQVNNANAANPKAANQHLLKEKAQLEADLQKTRKELTPKVEAELQRELASNASSQLRRLSMEIKRNIKTQELLEAQLDEIDKRAPQLVKGALNLAVFDQQIKLYEDLVNKLTQEIDFARAELEAVRNRVQRWGESVTPRADEAARKIRMAALAGLGALVAVLALISFLEFRARRIMSVDEVVHGLGLRLMGTLPAHPTKPINPSSAAHATFQTMLAESVDSARTMLLHAARAGSMRIVMVTSATSGEGKTSLASHLAVSLARAGRKTLLVDCDLRNPAAHRLFEVPLEPGFSEVLRGEIEIEDAVKLTKAAGLSLLSAGICDSEALQLLAQDGLKGIFAQLRADYDFIVVDSSPVLPVADSLLIAQHVDGVIFSILRDVSRMPKVYAAYQKLATLDAPMLGAVVNGTQEELYGYGPRYLSAAANASNNNG
jgi:capsular exopolysaccharide synthesis family protein